MNNKDKRMNTLKEASINTNKFFNINMNVPVGSDIKIMINGVPYDVSSSMLTNKILADGFVFNSRVDGRFVTAETFRLLGKVRKYGDIYRSDWDINFKDSYGFMYQFDMMKEEIHKLAKMEREDDKDFQKLSRFFTKEVVCDTCKHYIYQLKKYIRKIDNEKPHKCKGVPYVCLNKYGNVFLKDLDKRVFNGLKNSLNDIYKSKNYTILETAYKNFYYKMCKLPFDTPKYQAWKTAFKGKGAYVTLLNIIKFHGCQVENYETGEILGIYDSVNYVESRLDKFNPSEYWKFHELLKATIVFNEFDLRESIKRNL